MDVGSSAACILEDCDWLGISGVQSARRGLSKIEAGKLDGGQSSNTLYALIRRSGLILVEEFS